MSEKADTIFDDHILPKRGYPQNDINDTIECNLQLQSLKEENRKLEENTNLNKKIKAQRKAVDQKVRKSISELRDLKKYISQQKSENEKKSKELGESQKLLKQGQNSLDAEKAEFLEKSELMNKLEKALNKIGEELDKRGEEFDKREKQIEAREAYGKQNLASKSDITNNFTEIENKLTETLFMVSDEIIKAINVPQKKKPSKEKVNDDQVDFLKHKQSISLPEDYVFSLQDGEELGKCENLQDFISGIGRAKITGNIDDFLADFNFYFHDEGEPFFEVNIAELHENTQKDLIETFLKNT